MKINYNLEEMYSLHVNRSRKEYVSHETMLFLVTEPRIKREETDSASFMVKASK